MRSISQMSSQYDWPVRASPPPPFPAAAAAEPRSRVPRSRASIAPASIAPPHSTPPGKASRAQVSCPGGGRARRLCQPPMKGPRAPSLPVEPRRRRRLRALASAWAGSWTGKDGDSRLPPARLLPTGSSADCETSRRCRSVGWGTALTENNNRLLPGEQHFSATQSGCLDAVGMAEVNISSFKNATALRFGSFA